MTDMNFKGVRRLVAVSLGLSALLLAGCAGPSALRSSYIEYANAQAQVNNQQTLLNLARVVASRDDIVRDEVRRLEKKQARQQRWPKGLA